MAELLEEIKRLGVEEKYALADRIQVMADEESGIYHDENWDNELIRRALHAKEAGFQGRSFDEVLDEMEHDSKKDASRVP